MRKFEVVFHSAMDLRFSGMFACRSAALVNRTRRIGPKTCALP